MYSDCDMDEESTDVDKFGHPLSSTTLYGRRMPVVFVNYYTIRKGIDSRHMMILLRNSYPGMMCGEPRCTNPYHMMWHGGDRWDYNSSTGFAADVINCIARGREEHKDEEEDVGKLSEIDTELDDMSDEELLAVVNGQRKLRIQGGSKREKSTKPQKRKTPKQKVQAGIKEFEALPLDQLKELFRQLGGEIED